MDKKWYADGLNFSCQGCGGCCRGPGGYVWLSYEEMEKMAAFKGMQPEEFSKKYTRIVNKKLALIDSPKGDCIFINDQNRCDVYPTRPSMCKAFPWWPELLKNQDAWESNCYNCPGYGKGKTVPYEEIEKQMNESH